MTILFTILAAVLLIYGLAIVLSMSVLFARMGISWWQAWIPIWNIYRLIEVAELPRWWLIAWLVSFLFPLFAVVITGYLFIGVANRFNKSALYGVGLLLLAPLFWPSLALNRHNC